MFLRTILLATGLSLTAILPSAPHRDQELLLTFDAVWRIVDEEHFDPDINGVDWPAVRAELRPRAAEADDTKELRDVIREMLGRLKQSHFALIPKESLGPNATGPGTTPPGTCGFDLRQRAGRALVVWVDPLGPAHQTGVRPGWILMTVNGVAVDDLVQTDEARPYLRSETRYWRFVMHEVDGDVDSSVSLEFEDGQDRIRAVRLERSDRGAKLFNLPGLPTFYLTMRRQVLELDGVRLGVVHFSNWFRPLQGQLDQALVELRDCDGIVIDLRGNTGNDGSMATSLAGHFFDEPSSLGVMTMRDRDRESTIRPRKQFGDRRVPMYAGPLAILVDETSGSCSEVFTGGMQANGRARVFGTRTAGAALPATMSRLPNGDSLLHAIANFLTVRGESLEGSGVRPDEAVSVDRQELLSDQDAVLLAAGRWVAEQTWR